MSSVRHNRWPPRRVFGCSPVGGQYAVRRWAIATAIALDGCGGTGPQRNCLGRLRDRLGWATPARAERVGAFARGVDAGVFQRQCCSRARLEFGDRAWWETAWVELHAKFGKLPFERLFEPAISYGRNGFLVSPTIAEQWAAQVPLFESQPGFAEAFMPGGRAPKPGELVTLPDHSATLEMIASTNGEAFYGGELAGEARGPRDGQRRRHAGQ